MSTEHSRPGQVREPVERQSPTEAQKPHPAHAEANPRTNREFHEARAAKDAGGTHLHKATVHPDGSVLFPARTPEERANSGVTDKQFAGLSPANKAIAQKEGIVGRVGLTPQEEASLRAAVDYSGPGTEQKRLRALDRRSILADHGQVSKVTSAENAELILRRKS